MSCKCVVTFGPMRTVEKERGPVVLVLSNHFPKPKNPKMGIWGLRQAVALRRAGVDVTICSLTEWVPRAAGPFLRRSPRLRRIDAWASCPGEGRLEGLEVHWPRWPRHVRGPHAEWCFAHPRVELALSWPWARRKVLQIVDDVRPDVVYAHGSAVNGWVAARIQEERGIPFVLQDNDIDELRLAPTLPARAAHYREVGSGAKAWVVCGPQMIDDLRAIDPSQYPLLIPYGTEPIEPAHRGEAA